MSAAWFVPTGGAKNPHIPAPLAHFFPTFPALAALTSDARTGQPLPKVRHR